jgi:hypothetical protein
VNPSSPISWYQLITFLPDVLKGISQLVKPDQAGRILRAKKRYQRWLGRRGTRGISRWQYDRMREELTLPEPHIWYRKPPYEPEPEIEE